MNNHARINANNNNNNNIKDNQAIINIILQNCKCFHCNKKITYSSLIQNKGEWYNGKYYCSSHIYYANERRLHQERKEALDLLALNFGGLETGVEPTKLQNKIK